MECLGKGVFNESSLDFPGFYDHGTAGRRAFGADHHGPSEDPTFPVTFQHDAWCGAGLDIGTA